ncbi:hypothetical protein DL771_012311 [Monosporascus sp. 5C6A]|nr:hypothetical protein DL771_012311 [Monosporascus sp. 5C6A]
MSLVGLVLDHQIQLVLQLQALGLVDAFAVDQLVQKETFLSNFNLSVDYIIKRTINATFKRAYRGNKRVVVRKILCENANTDDPVTENGIDEGVKSEEDVVQEGEEAAQMKRLPEEDVAAREVEAAEESCGGKAADEGQAAQEKAAEDEAAAADEEAESDGKLAEVEVVQGEEDANANAT